MKNTISRLLFLFSALAFFPMLTSCALFDKDKSILSPIMWGEIDRNRANLSKLRIGMTREEVKSIMGEPMVSQVYNTENHWFYYTQTKWSDGRATRDECTPLVFDSEGLLAGWGTAYYQINYNYTGWTEKAIRRVLE